MASEVVDDQEKVNEIVVELVDATIDALQQSQDTKGKFQEMLEDCSDSFEFGEDAEGFEKLKDLTNTLRDFVVFCKNVHDLAECLIEPEVTRTFGEHCQKLEGYLLTLVAELEQQNFVEISDILRYDLQDAINAFFPHFEKIAEELKECRKKVE